MTARIGSWIAAASFVLGVAWLLLSVRLPFGWDHGIIASVGASIVDGGIPYRDAWDMKGPLAPIAFATVEFIFGRNSWGVRVLDIGIISIAMTFLMRMIGRWTSSTILLGAGAAYVLWYASNGWFYTAQPDGWVAAILLVGFSGLLNPDSSPDNKTIIGAALAAALATLVKPFYVVTALVPALSALRSPAVVGSRLALIAKMALAAMTPVALVLGWIAFHGGLDEFLEVHLVYPATAYNESIFTVSVRATLAGLGAFALSSPVALAIAMFPMGILAMWRRRPLAGASLAVWIGVLVVCVIVQRRFWVYHWLPLIPPLVIAASVGLASVSGRPGPPRTLALLIAGSFLLAASVEPFKDIVRTLQVTSGWISEDRYLDRFREWEYNARDEILAIEYIRSSTDANHGVYVFGNDATIGYLSGRRSPTRFVFSMPLLIESPFRKRYQAELIRELVAAPPEMIVVGLPYDTSSKPAALSRVPALRELLDDRYRLERTIGMLDIYRIEVPTAL